MNDEYVPGYDTAVLPVFEWVQTNDWMDAYQAHIGDFYGELAEAVEAPVIEILAQLPTALWARAARCCFDDFLTVEYDSSPCNALDQYLDEVGMDLEGADVDFLIAFRTSVVRVYYVVERTPYESVVLRDLSGGTRPIRIEDEMLTAALSVGDNIATRIVTMNDKDYLAGSILVLENETLELFKQAFEAAFKEEMRSVEKYLQKDLRQRNLARQRVLKGAAAAVSGMWVASVLAALEDTTPVSNEHDPETLFQASIPYESNFEQIVEFFDTHPDLDRPIPKEFFWLWHTDRTDPEASLKAMVWISGPVILLDSCDRFRIEAVVAILKDGLGDLIDEATIREIGDEIEGWDPLDEDEDDDSWPLPAPVAGEDDSEFRKRMYAYLDQQFRLTLDSPVPELNNHIPRELAKTVKGRKQLSKWLVAVEARLQATAEEFGFDDYNLRWMWEELGIETHRQSSLFE